MSDKPAVFGRSRVISETLTLWDQPECQVLDLEVFRDRLIELASLADSMNLKATWLALQNIEDGIGELIANANVLGALKDAPPFDWKKYPYMCDRLRFEDLLSIPIARGRSFPGNGAANPLADEWSEAYSKDVNTAAHLIDSD